MDTNTKVALVLILVIKAVEITFIGGLATSLGTNSLVLKYCCTLIVAVQLQLIVLVAYLGRKSVYLIDVQDFEFEG